MIIMGDMGLSCRHSIATSCLEYDGGIPTIRISNKNVANFDKKIEFTL